MLLARSKPDRQNFTMVLQCPFHKISSGRGRRFSVVFSSSSFVAVELGSWWWNSLVVAGGFGSNEHRTTGDPLTVESQTISSTSRSGVDLHMSSSWNGTISRNYTAGPWVPVPLVLQKNSDSPSGIQVIHHENFLVRKCHGKMNKQWQWVLHEPDWI